MKKLTDPKSSAKLKKEILKKDILGTSCQIAEDQRQRVDLKAPKEKKTVLLKIIILIFSEYTSQLSWRRKRKDINIRKEKAPQSTMDRSIYTEIK